MAPLVINLPHRLGKEEAKRRVAGGMHRLTSHIPGGAEVRSDWTGDRLDLVIGAMGQQVKSRIDVEEQVVRLEVLLPAMLGMFAGQIGAFLTRKGGELLEDKSK